MREKSWPIKQALAYIVPKRFITWKGTDRVKKVALTFDDGPRPQYTEETLLLLKKFQIKATFFLVGSKVEKYTDITRKIFQDGHTVGMHTFKHDLVTKMTLEVFKEDLEYCKKILKKISGIDCVYFRPPDGIMSLAALKHCISQKIITVLWSLSSRDSYLPKSPAHIIENVIGNRVKAGDIILFHDHNSFTLQALPEIIEELKNRKFSFVTIDEFVAKKR